MTDQEFVRSIWSEVEARWLPSMPNRFRVEMVYDSVMVWEERPETNLLSERPLIRRRTEAKTWFAAAETTRERLKQIAEIEEETNLLHLDVANCQEHGWVMGTPVRERILARLEAIRDELKRGMKS